MASWALEIYRRPDGVSVAGFWKTRQVFRPLELRSATGQSGIGLSVPEGQKLASSTIKYPAGAIFEITARMQALR